MPCRDAKELHAAKNREISRVKCEAGDWETHTGQTGDCPNDATMTESWFDEEGLEVRLCDHHQEGSRPRQVEPKPENVRSGERNG